MNKHLCVLHIKGLQPVSQVYVAWKKFCQIMVSFFHLLNKLFFTAQSRDVEEGHLLFSVLKPTNSCQNGLEIKWIQKGMMRNMTRMWGGKKCCAHVKKTSDTKCVKPQFTDQMCRSSPSAQTLCFKFTQEDKRTRQEWRWCKNRLTCVFSPSVRPNKVQTGCREDVYSCSGW